VNLARRARWGCVAMAISAVTFGIAGISPSVAAAPATFSANPTTGQVGDPIAVASITACPAPEGAGDWVAIVNVAQGSNDQVSYKDFLIADDGSWSGTIDLPTGLTLGSATLTATCFDASHDVENEVDYTAIPITVVAPTTTTSSTTTTAPPASTTTSVAAEPVSTTPAFTG